jgi:hypothetical protein
MLEHSRSFSDARIGDVIVHIDQTPSRASAISQFLLATPALLAWVAPIALCARLAADPATLNAISDRPVAAAQILLAFAAWSLIFGFPLVRLCKRLGTSRLIMVDAQMVYVRDRSWRQTRTWVAPVSSYRGIASRVSTTLSGLEHQLQLVHATDPSKNVIVAEGFKSLHGRLDELKGLLRLPEISGTAPVVRSEFPSARHGLNAEHAPAGAALGSA